MSDRGSLVYVVDDDASAREGVAGLIRSGGILTKTFASGEEFLAAPRPKMPSCLVLDLNLPGISGLDVQEELVRSGEQLPIIFLTGHGDIPTTVRAVKAGATDFLTKPVDDEALLQAIRRCLTADVERQTRSGQSRANDERFDYQQRPKVEERGLEDEIRSEFGFDDIVRREPGAPPRAGAGTCGCAGRLHGPDLRRDRHGQGIDRARRTQAECAQLGPVRQSELRRDDP